MWICVFTTCSTTFVPCDTHLDLCNVCIHEFVSMYVRTSMYVCMYVCMHVTYVCIAVYMYVYNQWRTKGVVWGFPPPPKFRRYRWILDRMCKKNRRLDFLL